LVDEAGENVLKAKVGGEYVTFRVYLFLLKVGEASVRDVYRGAGLSSPSLALHHLEKLEELKLVRKDEHGVYHVIARKFGVIRFFHKTGRWLLPRSFFYMILYAAIAVTSAFLLSSGMRDVAIIISAIGFTTSLIDTVLFLRIID
jgi:DNA-binding transcriptional ArsR family regulator